jgi:23S rRNA (adenine2030-N6)-methyltransferase
LLAIDTHAGAGAYRIDPSRPGEGEAARRLRAARDAPEVFAPLKARIELEPGSGALIYPGSPLLTAQALRPGDRLIACELQAEQHALLADALRPFAPDAEALTSDGYQEAPARLRAMDPRARALVLIDPPYERGDDYDQLAVAVEACLRARSDAALLIWAPLKDLETLDRLVRNLEQVLPRRAGDGGEGAFVAEVRLRPPRDPLRLNGCAVIALNPSEGLAREAQAACVWAAAALGEPDGRGRVWLMQPPS